MFLVSRYVWKEDMHSLTCSLSSGTRSLILTNQGLLNKLQRLSTTAWQTLRRDHIHREDHYKVINDCETALLDYLRGCEVFVAARGRK